MDNHTNTSSLNFTGLMLFLTPNQQCQSTEGNTQYNNRNFFTTLTRAIDMVWQNFQSLEFRTKFQREVPLFLEITEFPFNTV